MLKFIVIHIEIIPDTYEMGRRHFGPFDTKEECMEFMKTVIEKKGSQSVITYAELGSPDTFE